jgi:hypothetical protein
LGRWLSEDLRHSWDQGIKALEQGGQSVSGLVGEDAEEETGPTGGGPKEAAEDEEGVAKGPQCGGAVAKDLVLERCDQVEEEHVELEDGLGAGEGLETEAVSG